MDVYVKMRLKGKGVVLYLTLTVLLMPKIRRKEIWLLIGPWSSSVNHHEITVCIL